MIPMESLIADGGRVEYIVRGDGPPIVLLHGIGGGIEDWVDNIDPLVEAGHRVYVPSLPGHGGSDRPSAGWDPALGSAIVRDLFDGWGIERALLVGHSAGGLLAIQSALDLPTRIAGLVLVAPAGLSRDVGWALRLLTLPFIGRIFWRPTRAGARLATKSMFANPKNVSAEFIDTWLNRRRDPRQRNAFFWLLKKGVGLRGLRRDLVLADHLDRLICPVLTLWGEEDHVVPKPAGLEALMGRPDRRMVLLSPCGHWPQIEHADRFNREVAAFAAKAAIG
ncbi:MAG: alpha/beta fold hydrolase [Chloroflexi bacterium]|nr:alpha/beta fold hydrolase [Chloroflexota bacterium]